MPSPIKMNFDEYRKEEGVTNLSHEFSQDIANRVLSVEQAEDFERAYPAIVGSCDPAFLRAYYNNYLDHDLEFVMSSAVFKEDTRSMKILSELDLGLDVLEVGCFTGMKTVYLALNNPDTHFIGVDINTNALRIAKNRAEKYRVHNVDFVAMNVRNLSFDKKFSAVLAEHCLHEEQYLTHFSSSTDELFEEKIDCIEEHLAPRSLVFVTLGVRDTDYVKWRFDNIFSGYEVFFENRRYKHGDDFRNHFVYAARKKN